MIQVSPVSQVPPELPGSQVLPEPPKPSEPIVRVCQGRACRRAGAAQVLAAFEQQRSKGETAGAIVEAGGCFGECGRGPMVLFLPEGKLYSGVQLQEVPLFAQRFLRSAELEG